MNAKEAAVAREHRLANDRYHLTISDDGTGSSHFGALAITRRVPDCTRETDAFVMYVRDLETGPRGRSPFAATRTRTRLLRAMGSSRSSASTTASARRSRLRSCRIRRPRNGG